MTHQSAQVWIRLSALSELIPPIPGASPQAGMDRAFGAPEDRKLPPKAEGPVNISIGRLSTHRARIYYNV